MIKNKKGKILFFGSLLLLVVVTLVINEKNGFLKTMFKSVSKTDQALDKVSVHQAQFAGFYTAAQKGFYKDAGLDVSINPGGVDFPSIQMVAGGKEEFGLAEGDQIVLAREQGVPIVPLALIYRKNPSIFFSLKESGITTVNDFIGKNIGTKPDMMSLFEGMLKNAGVSPNQMKEIPVEYDISPLLSGKIDVFPGYTINETIVAEENGHDVNIIWPSDYGINVYSMALFTTEKMIEEKPDVVKRFTEATLKGWEYAYNNVDEAVAFTLLYDENLIYDHEKKMMQASLELIKPDDKPIGYMDEAGWKETEDVLVKSGVVNNPPDVSQMFGKYLKLFSN